jgi:hypothetical protein
MVEGFRLCWLVPSVETLTGVLFQGNFNLELKRVMCEEARLGMRRKKRAPSPELSCGAKCSKAVRTPQSIKKPGRCQGLDPLANFRQHYPIKSVKGWWATRCGVSNACPSKHRKTLKSFVILFIINLTRHFGNRISFWGCYRGSLSATRMNHRLTVDFLWDD